MHDGIAGALAYVCCVQPVNFGIELCIEVHIFAALKTLHRRIALLLYVPGIYPAVGLAQIKQYLAVFIVLIGILMIAAAQRGSKLHGHIVIV